MIAILIHNIAEQSNLAWWNVISKVKYKSKCIEKGMVVAVFDQVMTKINFFLLKYIIYAIVITIYITWLPNVLFNNFVACTRAF